MRRICFCLGHVLESYIFITLLSEYHSVVNVCFLAYYDIIYMYIQNIWQYVGHNALIYIWQTCKSSKHSDADEFLTYIVCSKIVWTNYISIQLTLVECIRYELTSHLKGWKPSMKAVFAIKSEEFWRILNNDYMPFFAHV